MSDKTVNLGKLGLFSAVIYGINSIIGSGIFLLPGGLYAHVGPFSLFIILIDVFIVLTFALCFADCSKYFDKNGGAYQYAKESMGDFVGFNVGLLGWLTNMIGWGVMAVGFSKLVLAFIPNLKLTSPELALSIVWLFTLLNLFGISMAKKLTNIITIAKLLPIIIFCMAALFFIKKGISFGNFTPLIQIDENGSLLSSVGLGTILLFYAFLGFEALPTIAGEVKNPQKNVSKAIFIALFSVFVIYGLVISGTIAILGEDIKNQDSPVQQAAMIALGPMWFYVISLGAIISIAGLNFSCAILTPRYGSAIAEDGVIPKFLTKENKFGVPVRASLLSASIASIIIVSGTFSQLAELAVLMFFIQYIPTPIASMVMRKRRGNVTGFTMPLGNVIPILALIFSTVIILTSQMKNIIFMISSIILSSLIYFFIKNFKGGEDI